MNTQPLISVIMPCKDADDFIQSAIRSVLSQSHQNIQLIIVDDGSVDTTPHLLERLAVDEPRLQFIALAKNSGGPATPRNVGLGHARGEYIAFIDADDIWLSNKLAFQLEVMQQHALNFSSTLHRHFSNEASLPEHNVRSNTAAAIVIPIVHDELMKKNVIVNSGVMLTAELAGNLHFSEKPEFVAVEDYLAWLNLHQRVDIVSGIIQTPLVYYRSHSGSISSSKIKMASKIYALLSSYKVSGKRLGIKRFYYFATYLAGSIKAVLSGRANRVED